MVWGRAQLFLTDPRNTGKLRILSIMLLKTGCYGNTMVIDAGQVCDISILRATT